MLDTNQARWVYRVARNFCGCLFLRIGHFFLFRGNRVLCFAETGMGSWWRFLSQGVLHIMTYMGRLRAKGVPFFFCFAETNFCDQVL